jgi:hypothetical protein
MRSQKQVSSTRACLLKGKQDSQEHLLDKLQLVKHRVYKINYRELLIQLKQLQLEQNNLLEQIVGIQIKKQKCKISTKVLCRTRPRQEMERPFHNKNLSHRYKLREALVPALSSLHHRLNSRLRKMTELKNLLLLDPRILHQIRHKRILNELFI